MPTNVTIPEDAVRYLNHQAKEELRTSVEQYRDDLLKEASRLEAATSSAAGIPQITSSMMKDADLLLRHGYRKPRSNPLMVISRIVAPVTGVLTGLLADTELLAEPRWLVAFVVTLALTFILTTIIVVKE